MSPEERKDYVQYRIETAYKTFDAAKLLAEKEYWNSAVNRLYCALFYIVSALLVLNEIKTKSHSATKNQFSLYFIKTGKLDKKYRKLLSQLFDLRQKGDYENIAEFTREEVEPLFGQVVACPAIAEIGALRHLKVAEPSTRLACRFSYFP